MKTLHSITDLSKEQIIEILQNSNTPTIKLNIKEKVDTYSFPEVNSDWERTTHTNRKFTLEISLELDRVEFTLDGRYICLNGTEIQTRAL